jgi:hypothetical protein
LIISFWIRLPFCFCLMCLKSLFWDSNTFCLFGQQKINMSSMYTSKKCQKRKLWYHWWNLPWQGSLLKQQIIQIYFKMLLNPMRTSERRFFWSVMDCWRGPWTLKVQLRHFLTNHNSSQDCFKTISFEHVDSWANILHFRTHHL